MLKNSMTNVASSVWWCGPASVELTMNRPRTLTGVIHVNFNASFRKKNFTSVLHLLKYTRPAATNLVKIN